MQASADRLGRNPLRRDSKLRR